MSDSTEKSDNDTSLLSMLSDSLNGSLAYFSTAAPEDEESSVVDIPRVVHPADAVSAEFDEHGFPIEPADRDEWRRYNFESTARQEAQQKQMVAWHEWLCHPAAAEAARQGGVVLEPEHLLAAKENAANGIPAAYRRTVYALLSHPVSPGVYASYCKQAETSDFKADRERYQVLQQIDRDIERTFTKHPSFKPGTQGVRSLRQVLRAIAMRFRHVGYCQGMNFVVAKLLVVTKHGAAHDFSISEVDATPVEEAAFWITCGLIDSMLPEAYFGQNRSGSLEVLHGLRTGLEVITLLIEQRSPELYAHLLELGVPPSVIAVRWMPCLFSGYMPPETCLRVWDLMLASDSAECVLYQTSVAVMEMHKAELMELDDPVAAFELISAACTSMYDADHLLSHIDSRIDASLVNKLRDEIEARHQPAGSQSPSNNSDNEQSKAVEMMSGWFEDLGASWVVVEGVFKDSEMKDLVDLCNKTTTMAIQDAPPDV